jgi:nitroimidazol reductase NimA-like FMN-containing flavoprotein (pyridoxamine 5'-phosphate oxidase superfamily)
MTRKFIYDLLRHYRLAVLATTNGENQPEAALIGFAVTSELEIVFDTVKNSRKYGNLSRRPKVALVIGWDNEITIQYEGEAIELVEDNGNGYKEAYYSVFPTGRQRATDSENLVYFVVKPGWIRYSNFNDPACIEEIRFDLKS